MDFQFKIFGIKFGLDPIFDFIPGIGSLIASLTSLYIFWIAYNLHVPTAIYLKMLLVMVIDTVIGGIPVVGVVFDIFYKSNQKNLNLILPYYKKGVIDAEIVE